MSNVTEGLSCDVSARKIVDVGWCPATLLPERETELRDINELCDSMGCVVCTASVYDLGYPPAENPGEEGDVLEIPF